MQLRTFKEKILNKRNKGLGLGMLVLSLLMIFSLIMFPYRYNPIFLFEILLMTVVGFNGLLVILFWFLSINLYYYLDVRIEGLSKRRIIFLGCLVYDLTLLIALIENNISSPFGVSEINPFVDYWLANAFEPLRDIWNTAPDQRVSFINMFRFTGLIIPIILWCIGGFWFKSIITLLIVLLLILYDLYVIIANEYIIIFSKLEFWRNEENMINVNQKTEGIDLNLSTEEFEMNFEATQEEIKETHKKLELIERVRKNMNKKNYEELSNKIAEEKKKLTDLRKRVLEKVKKSKEEYLSQSNVSDKQREEIMVSLGYTSYSSLVKSSQKNNEEKVLNDREPFHYSKPEGYVEENQIEENKELLNDGFKTTEEAYDISEPTLVDSFVEDMLDGYNPTMEVPLLENYSEIFSQEDELISEINKTLETIIKLEDEISNENDSEEKEKTGEVIIDGLDHLTTMEQYLSIPDVIAQSDELELSLNQSDAIHQQQEDRTRDSEYSSFNQEEQADAVIDLIDTAPQVVVEKKEDESEDLQSDDDSFRQPIVNNQSEVEEEKGWCIPYTIPSTDILSNETSSFDNSTLVQEATNKASNINTIFQSLGVEAKVDSFEIGPTITTFKIIIEPGIKTTKVVSLEEEIKTSIGAEYIRMIAPLPGTSFIGIEIPNSIKKPVLFKNVFNETNTVTEGIMISIGQDASGKSLSFDLTKAPHLLVAGSKGSGKSVAIRSILSSILLRYKPTDIQLVLIDSKSNELTEFNSIPHLSTEVITDTTKATKALNVMVGEMEERYKLMDSMGVKGLEELNEKLIQEGKEKLPYIVIILNELEELMMLDKKAVEESIIRITQKARAAGIHMVLTTQRPSMEVITGAIKSNIPSRIAFAVASSIDSRTILGQVGAEKLIGMGDMLVSLYGQLPFRGQGAYLSIEEVSDITAFVKSQCSPKYTIDIDQLTGDSKESSINSMISTNDPLYIAAKETVVRYNEASVSMLQRHLNIGYNKAVNIIDALEKNGVIGPSKGSEPREVFE